MYFVFCMCAVCLLSFVDFNKIFYPKKSSVQKYLKKKYGSMHLSTKCRRQMTNSMVRETESVNEFRVR